MMYNFHYPKIIASVWSALAKETVLSKVMNFVDGFTINLSHGFDDKQKKYIDTILKLDNSKTIMLETKWWGISVKNVSDLILKEGETIVVDFSEYLEEESSILYIDYPRLHDVSLWAYLTFANSDLMLCVREHSSTGWLLCSIDHEGVVSSGKSVFFKWYDPHLSFLNQKDKKDIQRWLQWGIHIMVWSSVSSVSDLQEISAYLQEQRSENKKIFAKIETQDALVNFDSIVSYADGIIVVRSELQRYISDDDIRRLVVSVKERGKPVFVTIHFDADLGADMSKAKNILSDFVSIGIDGYMLWEESAQKEEPMEAIDKLYDSLLSLVPDEKVMPIKPFYQDSDQDVIDYILYNVYRVLEDLSIRAIVCYTTTWYSAARLASFRPTMPVIAFTKDDDTYRYINLLWWVKWYKISQWFDYDNLKKVGKEMIRMMFKGSISLDEKILIVQVNEHNGWDASMMMNGIELYRFKDI